MIAVTANAVNKLTMFENEQAYRAQLLKIFCKITVGLFALSFIVTTLVTLVIEQKPQDMLTGTPPITLAVLLFDFWVYRLALQNRYRLASWLLTVGAALPILLVFFRFGVQVPLVLAVFVPVGLAIVLLSTREAVSLAAACGVLVFLLYFFQGITKSYVPPVYLSNEVVSVAGLAVVVIFFPAVVALWIIPANSIARFLQERNRKLEEALAELTRQQEASTDVSRYVIDLSANLKVSATQQNQVSREQVGAVAQVNTAVSELSAASSQIAKLAGEVDSAVNGVEKSSRAIEQTTEAAVQHSAEGKTAIENSEAAGAKIGLLYQELLNVLLDLNGKTSNMRRILDLLSNIASETHLLALNAAIEAAGAGEHGERFAVVAQEVKTLAQRSNEAGKEVVEIVRQIEEATQQAVVSAQNGSQLAQDLNAVTTQTGLVIEGFRQISEKSYEQAGEITLATQAVLKLTSMIKASTQQQRTASQQVLESLQHLTDLARQNVEGSALVSGAAFELEKASNRLTVA